MTMSSDPKVHDPPTGGRQAGSMDSDDDETGAIAENWRKTAPLLYDFVSSSVLEWPSLTVQFVPEEFASRGQNRVKLKGTATRTLLLGTHTSEGQPNSLIFMDVALPELLPLTNASAYETFQDYSGFAFGPAEISKEPRFNVRSVVGHPAGEPNKARFRPGDPGLVATISVGGAVTLLDNRSLFSVESSKDNDDETNADPISLTHHDQQGWGLTWNALKSKYLATAADDANVCIWDVDGGVVPVSHTLKPLRVFTGHKAGAQDVQWFPKDPDLAVSVGDDGLLMQWDLRVAEKGGLTGQMNPDGKALNTVAIHPFNTWLAATGGVGQEIWLIDLRMIGTATLGSISGHKEVITRIEMCPQDERFFMSCAADKRVLLWDITACGKEQAPEDADDGPPELTFNHVGHNGVLNDIAWNDDDVFPHGERLIEPSSSWFPPKFPSGSIHYISRTPRKYGCCAQLVASVSDDNCVQLWVPVGSVTVKIRCRRNGFIQAAGVIAAEDDDEFEKDHDFVLE